MTVMPKPAARRATARPIRPNPTTPIVLWCTSWPSIISGPQIHGVPSRRNRSPSPTRRAAARISANAVSAVVSVRTSGVLVASTPAAVQSGTFTLSNPTAWFATIFSCSPAAESSSASTFSVSIVMSASRPRTTSRRSWRGMPNSFSWTVTSQRSRRRVSGASMIGRVTSTFGWLIGRSSVFEGRSLPRRSLSRVVGPGVRRSWDDAAVTWTLETERLHLRPMELGDVDAFAAVVGDPYAMRFYPKPFDSERAQMWIERMHQRYERDGFGLLSVVDHAIGEMIGDCGPAVREPAPGTFVGLGWHVRVAGQGNAICTGLGRHCRDQAWTVLDVDRLISIIRPENVPSWSVARALGFRPWRGDVRVGMAHVLWSMERPVSP